MMGISASGEIVAATWNLSLQQIVGPVLVTNTWTHVVSTYSLSNGFRLYVNGTLVGSRGPLSFVSPSQTNTLTLGYPATGSQCSQVSVVSRPYSGYLDEFRVYSRELNATDILALANP